MVIQLRNENWEFSMFRVFMFSFVFLLTAYSTLKASPVAVENIDYKVSLSETLPGLDDSLVPQAGPTIGVTILNKFSNTGIVYPLNVYAINDYALLGGHLNLVCRTTPRVVDGGPRYSFVQLDLANPTDSKQFQPLKQFSLSPGNQNLLVVFDGKDQSDSIGLIQLGDGPAGMIWLYAKNGKINLFQKSLPDMSVNVALHDPVGWSVDSGTAAFLASAGDGTQDPQGKVILKDYLVFLVLDESGCKVAAEPVDLSPYHYKAGSVITDIKCTSDKATIIFSQADSSDNLQAEFPFPKPKGQ